MNNYKLIISYDGTHYFGWQKCPDGPTIEDEFEKALEKALGHPVTLQAASRTDRGVHALGQVVNFFSPIELNQLKLHLPETISLRSLQKMPLSFHPTLDSYEKEYHYNICNSPAQESFIAPFSWHIPLPLDIQAMEQAIPFLLGTRDFSPFTNTSFPKRENTLCNLKQITLTLLDNHNFRISLIGDRFLYKMARNLVGTLVDIGQRKLSPATLSTIFHHKDRKQAGVTAPAHGLFLKRVTY